MRKTFEEEVLEFTDSLDNGGVFRSTYCSWYSSKTKISLKVNLVTVVNNQEDQEYYEKDIYMTNGSFFEILYSSALIKEQRFTCDFPSQVKLIIKDLML